VAELLAPLGQALVEVQPPGARLRREQVRLTYGDRFSPWFAWAYVGTDQIAGLAADAGLAAAETWTADARWFCLLRTRTSENARTGESGRS
jgi:hypothetical protein